jgi:opacity protein-like surface antigen
MKIRMILAAGTLGTLLSSSVFADDESISASAAAPRMRAQAQVELLPLGSGKQTLGGMSFSRDTALAYGISAAFDYAITPYLSVGVAPRLVLNVKPSDQEGGTTDKEIDLRARVVGHVPVAPGLEIYGSLSPGYAFVLPGQDGVDTAKGFAIAGAAGVTYDVSSKLFLGVEAGYQRAFTSADVMTTPGQTVSTDLDLSYMHVGIGAGTRF